MGNSDYPRWDHYKSAHWGLNFRGLTFPAGRGIQWMHHRRDLSYNDIPYSALLRTVRKCDAQGALP